LYTHAIKDDIVTLIATNRTEKVEGSNGEREVLFRAALRQPPAAAQKPHVKLGPPMHEARGPQEAAKRSAHQRVVRLWARALVAVMGQDAVQRIAHREHVH